MSKTKFMGRRTAEIVSFILSSGIILSLLVMLSIEHFQNDHSPYLEIKTTVLEDAIKKTGNSFLIPIEVENLGQKAPSKSSFSVLVETSSGPTNAGFDIDYLARNQVKTIYLSVKEKPIGPIKVELESYQF